jgi:hypothetical protein
MSGDKNILISVLAEKLRPGARKTFLPVRRSMMKSYLILTVCLLLPLAGCDSSSEGLRHTTGVAQLPDDAQLKPSKKFADARPQEAEKARPIPPVERMLPLESGVYGISFGATIEDVMKWCAANNIRIENPTEEEVKESARKAVGRVKDLKEAYDFEMAFLTPLEEELLALAQACVDTGDVFQLAKIVAAKEKLEVLKNATVSYQGEKYYLDNVHKGVEVTLDNERRICTDDRITKTAYRLMLAPTEQSTKMMANGLRKLDIFFYGDVGEQPKAYATFAVFTGNSERNARAQFELVFGAICEKYGSPVFRSEFEGDIDVVLGSEFNFLHKWVGTVISPAGPPPDQAVWARNLVLFGSLVRSGKSVEGLKGGFFALLYCEPKAPADITELHLKAAEEFKKEYHQRNKEALAQMQHDF